LSIEGTFVVVVGGKTVTRAAGSNIRRILDQQVKLIDPDAVLVERSFAGFNYYFEWSGIPKNIGKAQGLFSYLKRNLKGYFVNFNFTLRIKLVEKGESSRAES